MNLLPEISIILPTYNREVLLARAIKSVISQSYQNWELIVWDDGSNDNSSSVVSGINDNRISYHYSENKGAAAARNQAISITSGDYLAFLDSDDEWLDDKLSIQVEAMQAHPKIDLIFSDFENINLVRKKSGTNFSGFQETFEMMRTAELDPGIFEIKHGFLKSLARGNYIATDTVIVKKSVIQNLGGFNEKLRNSEDFELWWRLGLNDVRVAFHDQVLMTRYKPEGSLTSLTPDSAASALFALDICAEEAISANRTDLIEDLKLSYRNAWQNMITACAMENDKKGMMTAFKNSLKYGFRPGSLRLLVEGLLKVWLTR